MNKNRFVYVSSQILKDQIPAAQERLAEPHTRGILNEAMEKWNKMIGERIQRDLAQGGHLYRERTPDKQLDRNEPDLG